MELTYEDYLKRGPKRNRFLHLLGDLESLYRVIIGFSHVYYADDLSTTFLSQCCTLGEASRNWEGKWSTCSENRWAGGKPPTARLQLKVNQWVMSSQWPAPKIDFVRIKALFYKQRLIYYCAIRISSAKKKKKIILSVIFESEKHKHKL